MSIKFMPNTHSLPSRMDRCTRPYSLIWGFSCSPFSRRPPVKCEVCQKIFLIKVKVTDALLKKFLVAGLANLKKTIVLHVHVELRYAAQITLLKKLEENLIFYF